LSHKNTATQADAHEAEQNDECATKLYVIKYINKTLNSYIIGRIGQLVTFSTRDTHMTTKKRMTFDDNLETVHYFRDSYSDISDAQPTMSPEELEEELDLALEEEVDLALEEEVELALEDELDFDGLGESSRPSWSWQEIAHQLDFDEPNESPVLHNTTSWRVICDSDECDECDSDEGDSDEPCAKKYKTCMVTCRACNRTYDGFAQCCTEMDHVFV
jgi:hypothetical protein